MPIAYLVPTTGADNGLDSLLAGTGWSDGTGAMLTCSFPEVGATWDENYGSFAGEDFSASFTPVTSAQQAGIEAALALIAEVADISFQRITETASVVGDMRFGQTSFEEPGVIAAGIFPLHSEQQPEGGDVWLSRGVFDGSIRLGGGFDGSDFSPGGDGLWVLLHEIGHALGLKHPHQSFSFGNATSGPAVSDDWWGLTVMSYRSHPGDTTSGGVDDFSGIAPQTLMLRDIQALQYIYGANMATRTDDTVYAWAPGERLFRTIWDAGGNDTIDWSNQTTAADISLYAGQWSQLGPAYTWREDGGGTIAATLAIAYGVVIEQALGGSGNDRLTGNGIANRLDGNDGNDAASGNGGNDTLDGGNGNDSLDGGVFNDILFGGAGSDSLNGGSGTDSLFGGEGYDTADYRSGVTGIAINQMTGQAGSGFIGEDIETILTGMGSDTVQAGSIDNRLETSGGTDSAFGGAGNDVLSGGNDNDTLSGDVGRDTLNGDAGNDVLSGGDETDSLYGGDGLDSLLGTGGSDRLSGGDDADVLRGGSGSDSLLGGNGNDLIYGATENDSAAGGNGNDRLYGESGADRLSGGNGADSLYGGDSADVLFGDAGNDSLRGGAGNDTLNGGTGADRLAGEAGADRFTFDDGHAGIGSAVRDLLLGFAGSAGDRVDLSAMDANLASSTDQAFAWRGTSGFTGVGQVRFSTSMSPGNVVILGNNDSSLDVDFEIQLNGIAGLQQSWFIL
jgi:Ca2+-binding RTX toxin-like protein